MSSEDESIQEEINKLGGDDLDIEDLESLTLKASRRTKDLDFYEYNEIEDNESDEVDFYENELPSKPIKPSSKYQTSKTRYNPRTRNTSSSGSNRASSKKSGKKKKGGTEKDIDLSSVERAIVDGNDIRRTLADLLNDDE